MELDRATALVSSVDGEAGAIGSLEAVAEVRRSEAGAAAAHAQRAPGVGGAPPRASGHRRSSGRSSSRTRASGWC